MLGRKRVSASSPCRGAGWGGSEWVWSASSSLCPGHLLFCLSGPLPRVHDTPCCCQLPGKGRDMDPTGWTPAPSSTTSSGSSWLSPSVLACTLGLLPGQLCPSRALLLCAEWSFGSAPAWPGGFCPHLSTQRQGEEEGGATFGPWAGSLGLSQALRWPCFGTWGPCCLPAMAVDIKCCCSPRWLSGLHPELHTAHVSGGSPDSCSSRSGPGALEGLSLSVSPQARASAEGWLGLLPCTY